MLKIVIDTNCLIDADADEYNYSNRIIDEVIAGDLEAYANQATLRENKLIAPQKLVDPNFIKKLEYYFLAVKPVETAEKLRVVEDDPQDNKILESAVTADANYLITSDKHLLKLQEYNDVKIVTPTQFWNLYQDENAGWVKWLKDFINA